MASTMYNPQINSSQLSILNLPIQHPQTTCVYATMHRQVAQKQRSGVRAVVNLSKALLNKRVFRQDIRGTLWMRPRAKAVVYIKLHVPLHTHLLRQVTERLLVAESKEPHLSRLARQEFQAIAVGTVFSFATQTKVLPLPKAVPIQFAWESPRSTPLRNVNTQSCLH